MKALLKKSLQGLMVVPALALALSFVAPVGVSAQGAVNCDTNSLSISSGADCAQGNEQPADLFGTAGVFRTLTNILLFLVGAISVIMLIIGGVRYVVSGGDQAAVTSAKNTILYAVIGIIVAFLAFAAVNFVTAQLSTP